MIAVNGNADSYHTIKHGSSVFILLPKPLDLHSSIFTDQAKKPGYKLLQDVLDETYDHWTDIRDYVFQNRPGAEELWHFYKVGWHLRIRYNKRVITYCIPCNQFFVMLLVLGDKAMKEAQESSISTDTKQIITSAKSHSEGYSFYLEVKDDSRIKDIKKLLAIKMFAKP